MASSSCTLEIRGASVAREFLPVMGKRGRHLTGTGSVKLQRRVIFAEAAMAISHEAPAATKNTSSTSIAPFPHSEFSLLERRPAAESAAEICVRKMRVEEERASVTPEKLDNWVRGSVAEIVRNIRNAPFLVQIFRGNAGEVRLKTEAASPENWPQFKRRWGKASGTPDAVILVEELQEEEETRRTSAASVAVGSEGQHAWGLAVQGRSMESTAFYILDTTSVRSTVGYCTHFTLVKAKCFGEPVELQLRNAWLVAEDVARYGRSLQ